MNLAITHPWELTVDEAKALQQRLAEKVVRHTTFDVNEIRAVAGLDVSIEGGLARAAAVVLSLPDLHPLDYALAEVPVTFPYIPGLLTFREGPGVLAALKKLTVQPDLYVFDGQGAAHPRRAGLAAHMGVILDRPSIGCAKSRLIGSYGDPGENRGDWSRLQDGGETIGAVLRTRAGVKPVFVSIGHRLDLETAVDLVLRLTRGYRLPEPTRCAHRVAGGTALGLGPLPSSF